MICRRERLALYEELRSLELSITGGGKEEISKGIKLVLKAKSCVVPVQKKD